MTYKEIEQLKHGSKAMMLSLDAYKYILNYNYDVAESLLEYAKKELKYVKSPKLISELEEMLKAAKSPRK